MAFDPKQQLEEKVEQLKLDTVEKARENFTQLPRYLIEQFLGIETKDPNEKDKPKNYTPFDEKTREKFGKEFEDQDEEKLKEARDKLVAAKKQFDSVKQQEKEAQEYFKKKEEERKKKQEEEDELRREQEQKEKAQRDSGAEPGTKQKRGSLRGKKKPEKTIENKVSFGKQ